MAKKKKQPSPKASPRRPQRKATPTPKKKKGKAKSKTPWLNADGTPNKKYKKIAKYLTKSGKIRKNAKLPFKVKTAKALFDKLYPSGKKLPPWYTKKGTVRKEMLKWLTKKGQLRKGVKLPKGVKTIEQLWDWVQSGKVKGKEDAEEKGLVVCTTLYHRPHWEVREYIEDNWFKGKKWRKVYMGGKLMTWKTWVLEHDDYWIENINYDDSPPSMTYSECYYKKRPKYRYIYV